MIITILFIYFIIIIHFKYPTLITIFNIQNFFFLTLRLLILCSKFIFKILNHNYSFYKNNLIKR